MTLLQIPKYACLWFSHSPLIVSATPHGCLSANKSTHPILWLSIGTSILVLLSQSLYFRRSADDLYAHLSLRCIELGGLSRWSTSFLPLDRGGFLLIWLYFTPSSASWKEMCETCDTRWRQRYSIRETPKDITGLMGPFLLGHLISIVVRTCKLYNWVYLQKFSAERGLESIAYNTCTQEETGPCQSTSWKQSRETGDATSTPSWSLKLGQPLLTLDLKAAGGAWWAFLGGELGGGGGGGRRKRT